MKKQMVNRQAVFDYVKDKYGSEIEYLWARYPSYAIFRHNDNNKWYGIVMDIPRVKLGLDGDEKVDILNVKCDDVLLKDMLLQVDGYYPAYHQSKGNWITILLDGSVPLEDICGFIDLSFKATASKAKKQVFREPKEWLIPANPKYYDIEHAFDKSNVLEWKQKGNIKIGDTVFIYIAAPVSAIAFKCKIIESDIPYDYSDKNLTIKKAMKIELLKRYDTSVFTFENLKETYGIYAIRGPRGIPNSLSEALNDYESE